MMSFGDNALEAIESTINQICEQQIIQYRRHEIHSAPAVLCDPELQEKITQAIEKNQSNAGKLISGAGHDAMVFANHMPMGMLFMRCEKGISHHPAEAVTAEDVSIALAVFADTIKAMGESSKL